MDVDFLNLTTEDQMDLMAMMMHMEKLAELSEEAPPPSASFTSGPSPAFYTAPTTPHSPVLVGPPPSISFTGTTSQEPILPNPAAATPSTTTELSFSANPCQGHSRASSAAMREMIFRIAAMQPIHIDPESVKPPKRRNVRISKDPQSVAARQRRERISERIRILQRLVPGGTKMDTASMLDEAIHYVKFLKTQVQSLERAAAHRNAGSGHGSASTGFWSGNYSCYGRVYELPDQGFVNPTQMFI